MLTKLLPPPGRRQQCAALALTLPTPSNPRPSSNPPIFNDAMTVRLRVFVDEQKCSPEGELDEDDARSWHWVMYHSASTGTRTGTGRRASDDDTTTTEHEPEFESGSEFGSETDSSLFPIGVIRLVPPPHAPHHTETGGYPDLQKPSSCDGHSSPNSNSNSNSNSNPNSNSKYDLTREPYIKLTRVAILREYRGRGLAKKLVDLALKWASEHSSEIDQAYQYHHHHHHDYYNSSASNLPQNDGQRRGQVGGGGGGGGGGAAAAAAAATSAPSVGRTTSTLQQWKGLVLVHAQTDKERLYARWGFETDSSLGKWDEEGIEHVGMWRRIEVKR